MVDRKTVLATAAVTLVVAGMLYFVNRQDEGPPTTPSNEHERPRERVAPPVTPKLITPPAATDIVWPDPATQPAESLKLDPNLKPTRLVIADTALELNQPGTTAVDDISIIDNLLRFYRKMYKNNPVAGLNEEVVFALKGNNPKRAILIDANHPAINEQGELLDRWGTPYFFHPVSGELMEIRSAGPDRKLWSDDDVILE